MYFPEGDTDEFSPVRADARPAATEPAPPEPQPGAQDDAEPAISLRYQRFKAPARKVAATRPRKRSPVPEVPEGVPEAEEAREAEALEAEETPEVPEPVPEDASAVPQAAEEDDEDLRKLLEEGRISLTETLEEEQLEDLKEGLRPFFSSLVEALEKASSPRDLRRLVDRFRKRIKSLSCLGANLSCMSAMLDRLASFGEEWARLEENAAPQAPVKAIESKEAELERIRKAKADRVNTSENHSRELNGLQADIASLESDLALNQKRRQEAWAEYQRLTALCAEQEQPLSLKKSFAVEGERIKTGLAGEIADLRSKASAVEEELTHLRAEVVVDLAAREAADAAVGRLSILKEGFKGLLARLQRDVNNLS